MEFLQHSHPLIPSFVAGSTRRSNICAFRIIDGLHIKLPPRGQTIGFGNPTQSDVTSNRRSLSRLRPWRLYWLGRRYHAQHFASMLSANRLSAATEVQDLTYSFWARTVDVRSRKRRWWKLAAVLKWESKV